MGDAYGCGSKFQIEIERYAWSCEETREQRQCIINEQPELN